MKTQNKKNNGITLIALVITIIILLILAGISIATLGGNNGLFSRAKEAKNNTLDAQNAENIAIASYNTAIDEAIDGKNPGGTGSTPTTYTVGQEVTVRGESFYVIEADETKDTVTLLAKYNLNRAGTAQAPNADYRDTACAFSTSNYWSEEISSIYFNLNEYSAVKNDSGSAVYKANEYATKSIGGTSGRLLTYEEVNLLKGDYGNILWGKDNTQGYLYYWLGFADFNRGPGSVWFVNGDGEDYVSFDFDYDGSFGVRPVIIISKGLVSH